MPEPVPLKDARKYLGHLVDRAAHHGEVTVVTRNGRPVARIAPFDESSVPDPSLSMNATELDLIGEALIQLDYKLRDAMKATTNIAEKNRIRRRIEDIDAMNGRINDLEYRGEVTPPGYRDED